MAGGRGPHKTTSTIDTRHYDHEIQPTNISPITPRPLATESTRFTMTSTKFWFLLLDSATGQPYMGTTADFVSLPPGAYVAEFRKCVLRENSSILPGIVPSQLLVYRNKAAFDERRSSAIDEGKTEPLKASRNLDSLGETEEDALIVVVPSFLSPRSSCRTTTDLRLSKVPGHKRKQRWDELNNILGRIEKKSAKANGSSSYSSSSATWGQVQTVFSPQKYVQPQRAVDDAQLDFLAQYLSYTTKCFGSITTGKEAKRLHFIAPVLVCVCFLLGGDVEIVAEEDLVGKYVKSRGHFEFMLKRGGTKAICIVEAKKDDVEQGMAQDLIGCEVAAEVGELDVVYGIVTNYVQWNFFCSRNDKVEMEECSLRLSPNGPERESLKEIAGKIYAMLADEEAQTE
jgi:hypothetical protein